MNKKTSQKGSTLIEGVIAMLILCIVIIALLMMAWIIIQGYKKPDDNYERAFMLNSLRDALSTEIKVLDDPNIDSISKAVNEYITGDERFFGWQVQNVTLENEICCFDLVQTGNGEDERFEVKLYVPAPR